MANQADIKTTMRGAQVHSMSGAAREAAQSAAAQAEAALMAAKEKAAQAASQVCPVMVAPKSLPEHCKDSTEKGLLCLRCEEGSDDLAEQTNSPACCPALSPWSFVADAQMWHVQEVFLFRSVSPDSLGVAYVLPV